MNSLKLIGKVPVFNSSQVKNSRIGIGFEKLDRDVFDPEKAYDKVAALGVKWVRLQSGWQRTEKQKGVYDFTWLDKIVDNLLRRGLQPWMCLCYGNELYSEKAKEVFGAVGVVPMFTEEEKQGWHNYVAAVTKHYAGKIQYYEVWNEPDGRWCWKHWENYDAPEYNNHSDKYGAEYGEFVKATAAAIREGDKNAKVIGGSTCRQDPAWLHGMFSTGAGEVMDALTYHSYDPVDFCHFRPQMLRGLFDYYGLKNIELIQGETGTQSREGGAGALRGMAWTPEKQAKFLARHMVGDMCDDVKFASYFSALDMIEALNGKVGDVASYLDYGYFGVLGAEFDENGKSTGTFSPKPSYYALQTIAALFREDFKVCDFAVIRHDLPSQRANGHDTCLEELYHGGFRRANGSSAFVWWKKTNILTETFTGTTSFKFTAVPGEPRLVNVMTGDVYEIPATIAKNYGPDSWVFDHLPCTDYPLMLTFGKFFDF